jgi:hypothetical protein
VGLTYTEKGFTLSEPVVNPNGFYSYGTQSINYAGSTTLFNYSTGGNTRLTQVGGGAFTLSSIDLTHLFDFGNNTPMTVTFNGTVAGGGTVTQSFTTDSVLNTLETFNFTNFTNLVSVDWIQNNPFHQFDNINVTPTASATAVPEPFTVLGTIFGAGYGVALKRKLAKAKLDKEDIS